MTPLKDLGLFRERFLGAPCRAGPCHCPGVLQDGGRAGRAVLGFSGGGAQAARVWQEVKRRRIGEGGRGNCNGFNPVFIDPWLIRIVLRS